MSGFLFTEGFESCYFYTYTSNEYFLIDGGYSERVPSASNAPRCGVLAAETKAAAYQPPATDYATCRVVHLRCFYYTKEK